MELGLRDKAVLVTGGSRGIGRRTALAFGAEGARVAITYHSDREAAEAVAKEIDAAYVVRMDLNDPESIAAAVAETVDHWQGLDVLVGNAVNWGSGDFHNRPTRIEDVKPEEWEPVLRANLEGNFRLVQAAAPALRRSGQGRLVLVSTDLAERGMTGSWAYGAAKAGLHGFVANLAHDLGQDGVLANIVMPGVTLEDGEHRVIPSAALAEFTKKFTAQHLPDADDVAAAIVFLCSARTTATMGEILRVNGGVLNVA